MTGIRRPGDPTAGDGGPQADRDIDQWLAELRIDAAGRERSRRRALTQASADEATVHAAIVDLAEREEPIVLEVDGDRLVRGTVRLVGTDVAVLRDGRTETIVCLDAVASIRLRPDQLTRAGLGRAAPTPALAPRLGPDRNAADLARVLAALAETEPMITLHRRGIRSPLTGTLLSVGVDVVVVHARPGGTTYVPLWSLVDVSLTGSG